MTVPPQPSAAPEGGIAAVVVLAAGQGTRMKSSMPKVLHALGGRSMLGHVLAATAPLAARHTLVVVGAGRWRWWLCALVAAACPNLRHRREGCDSRVRPVRVAGCALADPRP